MEKTHAKKCLVYPNSGPDFGCTCDGYHTFGELYDHRIALFISLCRKIVIIETRLEEHGLSDKHSVWRSKLHSNLSMFPGQFIMGIESAAGKQITYHLPLECWAETEFADTLEAAPEFDGHTPDDVIERLKKL